MSAGTATPGTRDTVLRWLPLAQKYSQKYNVPVEIIMASIDSESGGDPKAQGKPTNVGTAYGLLQGIDRIWGKHGDLTDPDYNLDTIVGQLMAPAWNKYHSAAAVRAVTYGGPGAVEADGTIHNEWGDKALGGWTIGQDVQRYLPKVEAYKRYLAQQQQPQAAVPTGGRGGIRGWTSNAPYTITGEFGQTDGPYPGKGHVGMDIGTPSGTPITAAQGGTIMHAGGDYNKGGYGNAVVMRTDDGFTVILGHLSSVGVQPGGRVAAGQLLGQSGNTGHAYGAHLHLEVRDPNGTPINPRSYFQG
jgi:murein DD-endopeptidase MepM/ murein hydrolase activator NlpD